ncbi:MAG: nucleotide exchange factor GrpE [Desulfobacterales bacterium]
MSLEDWKREISERFQEWLNRLDEEMAAEAETPQERVPDLYSFYEALCVLGGDVRKSTRRSHETFVRFGETLEGFETMLRSLGERLTEERQQRGRLEITARREFLVPFAEMLERLNRLENRLARPPDVGLLSARRKWAEAWSSLRQGFVLLREHFELLLREEGILPMETVGQPFDPTKMKAVAVEENDTLAHNTVVEELAAGYFHKGDVLKFAEVKISVRRGGR